MSQPRKGNWVVELYNPSSGKWAPHYSRLLPLRDALKDAKWLQDRYRLSSFRIRQVKSGAIIMADVL